jgi:hypothetical protein
VNIAGRTFTRSDITAAVIGSALGIVLAVAPGMVPGSKVARTALAVVPGAPAAPPETVVYASMSPRGYVIFCYAKGTGPAGNCQRQGPGPADRTATCLVLSDGRRTPLGGNTVGCGGTSPEDPPPAAQCTDVVPLAVSSTDAAATAASWATLYLSGPSEACQPAWRAGLDAAASGEQVADDKYATVYPAAHVTGPAIVSRSKGGLLSKPGDYRADVPTDSTASVVEGGNLRLRMAQNEAGLWQVTSASFSFLVLGPDGQPM